MAIEHLRLKLRSIKNTDSSTTLCIPDDDTAVIPIGRGRLVVLEIKRTSASMKRR